MKPDTLLGSLGSSAVDTGKTNFYWHNITDIGFKFDPSQTNGNLFFFKGWSIIGSYKC